MRPAAFFCTLIALAFTSGFAEAESRPNILFILTDDQRYDALGCAGNDIIRTPNLDRLAERGLRFENAFVTLSICSPCRAVCMTGQYNSRNGVTQVGNHRIAANSPHLPKLLRDAGYQTAMFGKWHMGDKPAELGFETFEYFTSNGPYYGRTFKVGDRTKRVDQFIDDYVADKCIDYVKEATKSDKPFFLWMCTQVPHMNHKHEWNARPETLQLYADADIQVPPSWHDDLSGKPPYLEAARSRQQALKYGYDKRENVLNHIRRYYAAVTEVDASIGRVLDHLEETGLNDNTWIVFMGDNGWLLGEHQFTSKVLAYEESMRVPMIIAGPKGRTGLEERFALNIDLAPTILELAGASADERMDGTSLVPILQGKNIDWRDRFVYEAPVSQLGTNPLWAVRTKNQKYIATHMPDGTFFDEYYDLQKDPGELQNLAAQPNVKPQLEGFRTAIQAHRNQQEE